DNCETTPRGASLKRLQQGDFLFFIARMEDWVADGPTQRFGFYLVGFLEISASEGVLANVQAEPSEKLLEKFWNNAHIRRGLADPTHWDRF
ncbi:MAG TPA: hypothetical protein DDY93_15205, partial [Dehalococcoidia bacterium]|nr:hypothetical protein [Dehalococcoidia bacterium]